MNYADLHYDEWLADQIACFVTHFECQVCQQELKLKERSKSSYSNTCHTCAAEIEKDMEDMPWA
jgi:hypothetical protein